MLGVLDSNLKMVKFFMQHLWMLHDQARAKRSQHLQAPPGQTIATDRNTVGRNMLHAFEHLVATCCHMLRVENRTSAHAWAQHCFTNPAKRLQHHTTSTNVA